MKQCLTSVLIIGIIFGCAVGTLTSKPTAAADDSQAVLQADRALELALGKGDKLAAGELLDADFTWTDWAGKTDTRTQVIQSFDTGKVFKPGAVGESAQVKEYTYGRVAVVQANAGKMHVLRIWVKRPAGWQALVYQEVKSLDAPPTFAPGPGKVCENPCKSVPYKPNNEAEKGVIAAYMGLESSAMAHSAADWSTFTAEEFQAASSNSDQVLDKPTRLAGLEHEKMAGVSPTPLPIW